MGVALAILVLTIVVAGIFVAMKGMRLPLSRYVLALPAGVAGFLLGTVIGDAVFGLSLAPVNPLLYWKLAIAGLLSGLATGLTAPKGSWWYGAVPVVFFYGLAYMADQVQSFSQVQVVIFAGACAAGLLVDGLRQAVVKRAS